MIYGILSILNGILIFFNKITAHKISLSEKFMLIFYVRHHGIAHDFRTLLIISIDYNCIFPKYTIY